MTPQPQNQKVDNVYLLTKLVELETKMLPLADAVVKLEENLEGTVRTKGIKEKIAQAEQNIDANKRSFEKLELHLKEFESSMQATLREAFVEITKKFDEKTAQIVADTQANKTAIQKIQPYINVIAWLVAIIGPIIVGLIISGQWHIGP